MVTLKSDKCMACEGKGWWFDGEHRVICCDQCTVFESAGHAAKFITRRLERYARLATAVAMADAWLECDAVAAAHDALKAARAVDWEIVVAESGGDDD